jgi:hypothetical protein
MAIMTRALRSLQEARGRKAMVLVSQGFIYEPDFKEMKDLVQASLRVNVPVYFIDTRGLKALPDFMTAAYSNSFDVQDTVAVLADIARESEGAEAVALDTGGFVVKNTNDLESGILRVSAESQAYYLLGYNPSDTARDGKYRKIEVRLPPVKAKGLKVRARRGYYAPRDDAREEPESKLDPEIARALDSPFERDEVPLRVAAFSFDEALSNTSRVMLAAEVDVSGFGFHEEEGRARDAMAFLIETQHRETGEIFHYDEKIEMALLPETRQTLRAKGYVVSRELQLPPGGYQAKVVVRDLNTGHIGSVIHEFEVPKTEDFRVSTPILADALQTQETPGGRPRPVLQVRRTFTPAATLYVQFIVLGAARAEATRFPRVSSGYEIRRADGSVLKSAAPTVITPTSLGSLIRLHGISLQTADPGDYELVLRVKDEIANRTLELREPFVVQAGGALAPAPSLPRQPGRRERTARRIAATTCPGGTREPARRPRAWPRCRRRDRTRAGPPRGWSR